VNDAATPSLPFGLSCGGCDIVNWSPGMSDALINRLE
jgi:hypothetical protein